MQKFSVKIVDSKGYQRSILKINAFFALCWGVVIFVLLQYKFELFDLHLAIVILLIVLAILAVLFALDIAFRLDKYCKLGELIFDQESITISRQGKEVVLKVNDLTDIQFTLNSPNEKIKWMREMKNDGANNWISFGYQQQKVKMELFLQNVKEDELFLATYEYWKLTNPNIQLLKNTPSFLNKLSKLDKDYILDNIFEKFA